MKMSRLIPYALVCLLASCDDACDPAACRTETADGTSLGGYEFCDDGRVYRAAVEACPTGDVLVPSSCRPDGGEERVNLCVTNDDCTGDGEGFCQEYYDGCFCSWTSCGSDDDCGPGYACVCEGVLAPEMVLADEVQHGSPTRSSCAPAECRSDADCEGQRCKLSEGGESCCSSHALRGFFCTTSGDECVSDDDCRAAANGEGGTCAFDLSERRWRCEQVGCACD